MKIKGAYDAIVNPVKGKYPPELGSVTVMVSIESDLKNLCKALDILEKDYKSVMMSRLYSADGIESDFSIIGPVVGASYATILLENLIVWGARDIIFVGYCGAVSSNVKIGDIIIVKSSIIDEGVSKHYEVNDPDITHSISFNEGVVWTTDAVFRETREKVAYYQAKDVLGVEMETSALFSVAAFRGVNIAAVLLVSDEISDFTWRIGFKDKRFIKGCDDISKVVNSLCNKN